MNHFPAQNSTLTAVETRACDRHGSYEARCLRGRWTICPRCVLEDSERQRASERAERVREDLASAGIPAKYGRATLSDDGIPKPVRAWATNLVDRGSQGPIVLVGPPGVGKSHSACAALAHAIGSGLRGSYLSTPAYVRAIRDTWGRHAEPREAQILGRFAKTRVLVIDELGMTDDAGARLVQELVAVRYDADLMRNTILCTNLDVERLEAAIGDRAADRIRENATLVPMIGVSRRRPT